MVFWVPESSQSDCPVDEESWKEIDTSKDFDIDVENIEKTYSLLTGEGSEEAVEDEGDVKLDDSEEEPDQSAGDLGDVGDDFLDDNPEEDAKSGKVRVATPQTSRRSGVRTVVRGKTTRSGRR
jgi:hypothetical protein